MNEVTFFLNKFEMIFFCFQPLHRRTPSQKDIAEFKDLTKIDALNRLQKSLSKLLSTASPQTQKVRPEDFRNFS